MGLGLPELAQLRALIDSEIGSMPVRTVREAIERVMVEELPRLRQPDKARSHIEHLRAFVNGEGLNDIPDLASRYRAAHPHLRPSTCNRALPGSDASAGWLTGAGDGSRVRFLSRSIQSTTRGTGI